MKKTILSIILVCTVFTFSFGKGVENGKKEVSLISLKDKSENQTNKLMFSCTLQSLSLTEDCGNGETRTSTYVYCSEDPFNGVTIQDRRGECPPPPPPGM
jgi:hypothetical protein